MSHRAEQIMQAVVTTLTGLATTGGRVYRGRSNPTPEGDANALLVWQGPDDIIEEMSDEQIDSELTVYIDAQAREISAQIDTTMNQIRLEVTRALAASETLGLAFVQGIQEEGTDEPGVSGDGDRPIAGMRMTWVVLYRYTRTDPET